MKTKYRITVITVLCALATLFLYGCASTQNMASSSLKKDQLATIEVNTTLGSGAGARISHIRSIDGRAISGDADYVTVEPGIHDVAFDFEEVIDPGSHFGFTINLFGNQSTTGPRPSQGIMSDRPIDVEGNFQAGRTYCVDTSSMHFNPVPLSPAGQQLKNALGFTFVDSYILDGSPSIREK